MAGRSRAVTAYIAAAAPFARPILKRVRAAFHRGRPGVEETLKWGHPFFGWHGIVGHMAAFKQHVAFGFWQSGRLSKAARRQLAGSGVRGMGGARLTSTSQLPSLAVLARIVAQAALLNERGLRRGAKRRREPRAAVPPADLKAALARNAKARRTFDGFSFSARAEYVEWIVGAKRQATRARRLATTIEWLAAGKPRNWKYTKERR